MPLARIRIAAASAPEYPFLLITLSYFAKLDLTFADAHKLKRRAGNTKII